MKNLFKNRWFMLTIGCVCLFFAGVIYAWSILKAPLAEEFAWNKTQMQFCFTLTLCFFCLGGLVSGLIAKKVSLQKRLLIAAGLSLAGFALVAVNKGSLFLLYISYGVLAGTGIGFIYNLSLIHI